MIFPLLKTPEVHRLSSIAARLQSEHDGEVLSAARHLTRALDRHGLRISDIIQTALEIIPKEAEQVGLKDQQWHFDADICVAMPDEFWTVNQWQFLIKVRSMMLAPSAKQLDYLAGLLRHARAGAW